MLAVSRFRTAALPVATVFVALSLATATHAQIVRDDFNAGLRSDLGWSFQSPSAGGGLVGSLDSNLLNFSAGRLNIDTRSNGSLFGDNNVPVNVPNLTVVSVPESWYVETSVLMNLADLTNRTNFTQANLHIYRNVDSFFTTHYVNNTNTPSPESVISTNVQTAAGNSGFGGFFGTAFAPNNALEVRLRVENKAAGTVPGFVLGGSNPGIFLGYNLGAGWVTYGNVVNNSGDPLQQQSFNVLSQVAPGYRLGLGAGAAPASGSIPVARFDYIETNLGVASAAPEPGTMALFALTGLPLAEMVIRRRTKA